MVTPVTAIAIEFTSYKTQPMSNVRIVKVSLIFTPG